MSHDPSCISLYSRHQGPSIENSRRCKEEIRHTSRAAFQPDPPACHGSSCGSSASWFPRLDNLSGVCLGSESHIHRWPRPLRVYLCTSQLQINLVYQCLRCPWFMRAKAVYVCFVCLEGGSQSSLKHLVSPLLGWTWPLVPSLLGRPTHRDKLYLLCFCSSPGGGPGVCSYLLNDCWVNGGDAGLVSGC